MQPAMFRQTIHTIYVGPSYSGACVSVFTTNTDGTVNPTYVKSLE